MDDFHKLNGWEKAQKLSIAIHMVTKRYIIAKVCGFHNQFQRSDPLFLTNTARGHRRDRHSELTTLFQKAMSPSSELDYLLLLAYE